MRHEMKLKPQPFQRIKEGSKTVELRLFDEKRRLIKVGDTISFTNTSSKERSEVVVVDLQSYKDFFELYAKFDKISMGYEADEVAVPEDMYAYYPEEEIAKYGVVAIVISLL